MKQFLLQLISAEKKTFFEEAFGFILYFLSLMYSGILVIRLFIYKLNIIRTNDYNIKVISVGNMTVGGTGKTPLVEKIAAYLLMNKKRVAIISRGYKGMQSRQGFLADEPQMLKTLLPEAQVIINKDRNAALKLAQGEMDCDIAVLDDAFGNLRIHKNLDIVCIDCMNPFGFGYVLPRGLLRLPFCYLRNAQVFVLTHSDMASDRIEGIITQLRRYNKKAEIFQGSHVPESIYNIITGEKAGLSFLKDERVALLCGIAKPELFQKTVAGLGAQIIENFYFEDHHAFTNKELQEIICQCMKLKIKSIITTAKDEPRIKAVMTEKYQDVEILILKIKLEVEKNEGRFLERISAVFAD